MTPLAAAKLVEALYFGGLSFARALKEVRLTTNAQRSRDERNRRQARACRSPYRRAGIGHPNMSRPK